MSQSSQNVVQNPVRTVIGQTNGQIAAAIGPPGRKEILALLWSYRDVNVQTANAYNSATQGFIGRLLIFDQLIPAGLAAIPSFGTVDVSALGYPTPILDQMLHQQTGQYLLPESLTEQRWVTDAGSWLTVVLCPGVQTIASPTTTFEPRLSLLTRTTYADVFTAPYASRRAG